MWSQRLKLIVVISISMCLHATGLYAQYKTEEPNTYQNLCFYVINKQNFSDYKKVKKQVLAKEYVAVLPLIRKMRVALHQFKLEEHNRAFELWYIGSYTDFEEQVKSAKESTIAFLRNYENRLKSKQALYYDHRMFLEHYLAYETAYFYPEFWFMSMERYFAKSTVERIVRDNEEGRKLFQNSEYYRPFDVFNDLAESEEADVKDYLDMDQLILDTTTFIPYSYIALNQPNASYILANFDLDDATQDIDTDRQVTALKKMLQAVADNKAILVARLNLVALRRFRQESKQVEASKDTTVKKE